MSRALPAFIEPLRRALSGESAVKLALLFGSQARGDARDSSDVDVAVVGSGVDPLALSATLSRAIGREVHVVVVDVADPGVPLLEELVRDAIPIYEASPGAGAFFRSRALAQLELDRPWYRRMRDAWLARVAREGI